MASLYNNKISTTYVGLIKTIDNAVISASLRELTDGSGNATGLHLNNAGDFKVTSILEFGSLKDTGENITITKFVDEADGIASNDNDTTIPTSAAVVDYVASRITLEDLDFSGDSGTGSVDLDSQVFAIVGTANEIETSGGSQQLQIGLPDNVTITGNLQVNGLLKGNNNIVIKDTSDRTMAAFYGGNKVELYFNDSKKFETTSDGATVTGGLTATGGSVFTSATFSSNVTLADNANLNIGSSGADLRINHDGTDSFIQNFVGNLEIQNGANDKDIKFSCDDGSGGITEYFRLDGSETLNRFYKNVKLDDNVSLQVGSGADLQIKHDATDTLIDNYTGHLYIRNQSDDKSIYFQTDDGSGGVTTYMKVDGLSNYTEFPVAARFMDNVSLQFGSSNDGFIVHNGTDMTIENSYLDGDMNFKSDDGSGGSANYFWLDGGAVLTRFSKGGNFEDSVELSFGNVTDRDLRIYHNTSDSHIDNYTGNLNIVNNANNKDINFYSDDGSGGVEEYFRVDGLDNLNIFSVSTKFLDNVKVKVGTSSDLEIYHDGSNSYIQDSGVGSMKVGAENFHLMNATLDEYMMTGTPDQGVILYYNNSTKFQTTSGGVTVTGTVTSDGLDMGDNEKIRLGDSQDLEIYHNGSHSYIDETGTGGLIVRTGDFYLRNPSDEELIYATSGGAVNLYYNNSKKLETTSTGITISGNLNAGTAGWLEFLGVSGSPDLIIKNNTATSSTSGTATLKFYQANTQAGGKIVSARDGDYSSGSTRDSKLEFYTSLNASDTLALSLDSSQNASFSSAVTIAGDLTVNGTTTTVNTSTLAVEDPLISMAKDNSANSVDIGFYGRYNDGSNRYLGLYADASDSNTFNLFKGTTTEPTTTVDITATGYALADLNVANVDIGVLSSGATAQLVVNHEGGSSPVAKFMSRTNRAFIQVGDNDTNGYIVAEGDEFAIGRSSAVSGNSIVIDSSHNTTFAGNVSLADSKNLKLGAGQDLELFHNGTDSYIQNSTGHLNIINYSDDKRIEFQCDDGSGGVETYFYCDGAGGGSQPFTVFPDSAVLAMGTNHDTYFQHTGSHFKIDNYTGNIQITNNTDDGDISFSSDNGSGGTTEYLRVDGGAVKVIASKNFAFTDNVKAEFGDSGDLEIYHDGSHSRIKDVGSGHLTINATDFVVNNSADTKNMIIATDGGSVNLYYDASQKFRTVSGGVEITGAVQITGDGSNAATLTESSAGILTIASVDDLTLDSGSDISLDAGGNDIRLKVNGVEYAKFKDDSDDLAIFSSIQDKDILFKGNDGGSVITALTLDMSNGGSATFSDDIDLGGNINMTGTSKKINISGLADNQTFLQVTQVGNETWYFKGESIGGGTADYITIGTSSGKVAFHEGGGAIFEGDVTGVKGTFSDAGNGNAPILHVTDTADTEVAWFTGERTSDTGAYISIRHLPSTAAETNRSGIKFQAKDDGDNVTTYASLIQYISDYTGGTEDGIFTVNTMTNGSVTEKMKFLPSGEIVIGQGSSNAGFLDYDGTNLQFNTQRNPNTGSFVDSNKSHAHIGLQGSDGGSKIVFATAAANNTTATTRMTINKDGQVGIGTTPETGTMVHIEKNAAADTTVELLRLDCGENSHANGKGGKIVFRDISVYDDTATIEAARKGASSASYLRFRLRNGTVPMLTMSNEKDFMINTAVVPIGTGLAVNSDISSSSTTAIEIQQNTDGANKAAAAFGVVIQNGGETTNAADLSIHTATGGSLTEKMRILSSGSVIIANTAIQTSNSASFYAGTNGVTFDSTTSSGASGGFEWQTFRRHNGSNAVQIGSISMDSTSGTNFNTSSDYRLKEDLKDFNGLDKVSKIKMYDFKWKADGGRSYGVIAHELQEVLPNAVTGEKDGVDDEGNNKYQGVDYSKIVPLLVKSIQELKAEIEELKKK